MQTEANKKNSTLALMVEDSCQDFLRVLLKPEDANAESSIPQWQIGDFELHDKPSISSSSVILDAFEPISATRCVIKKTSKAYVVRNHLCKQLERELNVHQRLKHLNVLLMYAWFHDGGSIYSVLERADFTVAQLISNHRSGGLDVLVCQRLLQQLFCGLRYLHSLNIVHRDIKPSNLFLVKDGGKYTLKIGDFGCCVHTTDVRRSVRGTAPYMAPEVVSGAGYSCPADVWSAGITGHELVTGELYFDGDSPMEIFRKITKDPYRPPQLFETGIGEVLSSCLDKDPLKRFTAGELIRKFFDE